ncbi:hypothetical protein FKB34_07615 [Glycocaulis profundi]|nr:hypothetical protein FKB34_07615 [Glycocaulis profundi]
MDPEVTENDGGEDPIPSGPLQQFVKNSWEAAFKKYDEGYEIHSDILLIELRLRTEKDLLNGNIQGGIKPSAQDLFLAEYGHASYKGDFFPARQKRRASELKAFGQLGSDSGLRWNAVSDFGIKTLMLGHGSLAIAGVAALSQGPEGALGIMLSVMVFLCAVGASLTGLGIIILLNYLGTVRDEYNVAHIYHYGATSLNETRKKLEKIDKNYKWGDYPFYASYAILVASSVSFSVGLIFIFS